MTAARALPADDLRAQSTPAARGRGPHRSRRRRLDCSSSASPDPRTVKQAYARGDQHATGALLNRLFHTAFTAGKRLRSGTELAEGAVSVSYAALGLARKIVGDLNHASVLVIGAGEMAELTARHFAAQQPKRITVCSRTAAHAEALAADVGGTIVPWSDLDVAMSQADIVVTATGATTPILTRPRVQAALRQRRGRPLSSRHPLPRDVDPLVAATTTFPLNIDPSSRFNEPARRAARLPAPDYRHISRRFMAWSRSDAMQPSPRQLFERSARRADRSAEIAALPADPRARSRGHPLSSRTADHADRHSALPDQELELVPDALATFAGLIARR